MAPDSLVSTRESDRKAFRYNGNMSKGRPKVNKDLPVNRDPAFTARLAEAVGDSGLDKNEIARLAGVKRAGTMSDWLAGQVPAGRALLRLPGILGVSGHWASWASGITAPRSPAMSP
jgi:hypothetical protein